MRAELDGPDPEVASASAELLRVVAQIVAGNRGDESRGRVALEGLIGEGARLWYRGEAGELSQGLGDRVVVARGAAKL